MFASPLRCPPQTTPARCARPSLRSRPTTTGETYGAKARLAELTNEMESIFGVFPELKPSGTKPRLAVIRLDPNARLRWTTMGVSLTRDNRGLLARLVGAPLLRKPYQRPRTRV